MANKTIKFKIPVLALTALSVVCSLLMFCTYFYTYEGGYYGSYLEFTLPTFSTLIGWSLWMLPPLVLAAYLLLQKQAWSKFCVPAMFALMAVSQLWSMGSYILRFFRNAELLDYIDRYGFLDSIKYVINYFSNGYLFTCLTVAVLCLLMGYAALKGFANKALVVAPALFLLWLEVSDSFGFVSNLIYYIESEMYLYIIDQPIIYTAYLSFYGALVLFAIGHGAFEPILKGKEKVEAVEVEETEEVAEIAETVETVEE